MGRDNQDENFEKLQPANLTGYFTYPITCTGMLVSVNARGFCRKTNKSVVLHIGTAQFADEAVRPTKFTRHLIEAECDTSITIPVNGSEYMYYRGNINVENQNIKVLDGEYLGVRFESDCTIDECLFQPAIVNESSKLTLFFVDDNYHIEPQRHTSLLFSVTCKYVYVHG